MSLYSDVYVSHVVLDDIGTLFDYFYYIEIWKIYWNQNLTNKIKYYIWNKKFISKEIVWIYIFYEIRIINNRYDASCDNIHGKYHNDFYYRNRNIYYQKYKYDHYNVV